MGTRHLVVTGTEVELIHETLYEFVWGVMFNPKRLTVSGDTAFTQLSLSRMTFLTYVPILMKVWNIEVRR